MQVILIQDVNNLGGANELVTVKNGYGRNYLIPQKFAVEANSSNLKKMEEKLKQMQKKEAKLLAEINLVIAKLKDGVLKLGAKVGTSGKIFGSVTSVQIARAIKEQKGYEIDRRRIQAECCCIHRARQLRSAVTCQDRQYRELSACR